jgi:hypothetical protein
MKKTWTMRRGGEQREAESSRKRRRIEETKKALAPQH